MKRIALIVAAGSVLAGELTQAVRDTTSELGPISEGDWIGIVRGDGIVSVAGDLLAAGQRLLDHLLADGRELLTVVAGVVVWAVFAFWLHGWLIGVRPFG